MVSNRSRWAINRRECMVVACSNNSQDIGSGEDDLSKFRL
jgi:hypothetical protein